MEFLYFLVKGTSTYGPENDPIRLLQNYFETEGAFTSAVIIALVIALVFLFVFYGVFGMKIYKLANKKVYWITFAIVGLLTFCVTQFSVIGSHSSQTGFFASAETGSYFSEYIEPLGDEDSQVALEQREDLEDKMDGLCDVVVALDLSNAVYAMLIFFVLSICVKGVTTHAKQIPF